MGNPITVKPHHRSLFYFSVGAVAIILVISVLNLPYFRPKATWAVQGPSSVLCGSPDLLLTDPSHGPVLQFGWAGPTTQQILSCASPFGGVTQSITLRISRDDPRARVAYTIKIDGSSSPLIVLQPNDITAADADSVAGWHVGQNFISTTQPIKFNSSLVILATVTPPPYSASAFKPTTNSLVTGHVLFEPEMQEVPVKFLTPQTVNINGQPIHTWVDNQITIPPYPTDSDTP